MRILFVASEGLPYSKTGGLADVVEALPRALAERGHEVAVVLPRYRGTKPGATVLPRVAIAAGGPLRFPAITGGEAVRGVVYYFVDDPAYFDRAQLYGDASGDYPDNAERFGELCRAAIEIARQVWPAEVFHCHDWQTALLPVLLRTQYGDDPRVKEIPVVFTVHNIGYQGVFPRDVLARAGIPANLFHPGGIEFFGSVNLLKGGLVYSDYLTTVSPRYAQEIQTREYGHGLDGVIRERAGRLRGILNGADYSVWSPENDAHIAARYSRENLAGKKTCKQELLEIFGLPAEKARRALIGIVSRFADQKGFDLIAGKAQELMKEDAALVALGKGERRYEELFRTLRARFPGRVGVKIGFDDALAHKIEAGADIFLMPSRYEPCGLNQIYSLRYGTVPVVRATGGLDDTIEEFDAQRGTGTGFKFANYSGEALLDCIRRALHAYADERTWRRIQQNGMAKDFSWKASAAEYEKLYEAARAGRNQTPAATSNGGGGDEPPRAA
ncbi:MAG TPA: glycogen synthase GlgA [Candidatus Acidoferrales bacterium]|nr:glycogen synthase GlgA [Candidatus Acidoferrales bacterium]